MPSFLLESQRGATDPSRITSTLHSALHFSHAASAPPRAESQKNQFGVAPHPLFYPPSDAGQIYLTLFPICTLGPQPLIFFFGVGGMATEEGSWPRLEGARIRASRVERVRKRGGAMGVRIIRGLRGGERRERMRRRDEREGSEKGKGRVEPRRRGTGRKRQKGQLCSSSDPHHPESVARLPVYHPAAPFARVLLLLLQLQLPFSLLSENRRTDLYLSKNQSKYLLSPTVIPASARSALLLLKSSSQAPSLGSYCSRPRLEEERRERGVVYCPKASGASESAGKGSRERRRTSRLGDFERLRSGGVDRTGEQAGGGCCWGTAAPERCEK